jgi:hypothetical protein
MSGVDIVTAPLNVLLNSPTNLKGNRLWLPEIEVNLTYHF